MKSVRIRCGVKIAETVFHLGHFIPIIRKDYFPRIIVQFRVPPRFTYCDFTTVILEKNLFFNRNFPNFSEFHSIKLDCMLMNEKIQEHFCSVLFANMFVKWGEQDLELM